MNSSADILIIGGGAMGLATAIELAHQDQKVTILSRSFQEAAVHAAAGMLAPQAEGLTGPMLDLCLQSRAMYGHWIQSLEKLTGLDSGYWPCGILAPVYEQLTTTTESKHDPLPHWLSSELMHLRQQGLGQEVIGGQWFPEDAQVNNQRLAQVLFTAAQKLGVNLCAGVTATAIQHDAHRITQVETTAGNWQAQTYVLATGAWSAELLPIPVSPRKGQLLSVRCPQAGDRPPQSSENTLKQVLFGSEIYLVPRQDGQIIVGATSEDVGFKPHNTPAGIQQLLAAATRLFPDISNYIMEDFWWGFRPATPDELPILGVSPYNNLVLATGHYRNGILLTPITAKLITQLILDQTVDPLLNAFGWDRFDHDLATRQQPNALAVAT